MTCRNGEGYRDPTAWKAVGTVSKEEKKKDKEVTSLIIMLKQIISLAGFELVGRIALKDKETGKEYR